MQTTTTENVTGLPEMHRRMVWRADKGEARRGGGGKNGMLDVKGKGWGVWGWADKGGGREIRVGVGVEGKVWGVEVWRERSSMWGCGGK